MCKPSPLMSTPSIMIRPSESSIKRKRAYKIDDLPAPVLPTMPTFIHGLMMKLKFFSDGGRFSLYRIVTF
jgi:hypothetical protein